ncbi:MAG TPA: hypothetical protein VGI39_23830, partial [Polyangiaceae bacterium]
TLLARLETGAGTHNTAYFHIDLDLTLDALKQPLPPPSELALRGGALRSRQPSSGNAPFLGGDPRIIPQTVGVLEASVRAECPLYLLHYDFARSGSEWSYEITVQSLDEFVRAEEDRRSLDDATEAEMVIFGGGNWNKVSVLHEALRPRELIAAVWRQGVRIASAANSSLKHTIDAYYAFYSERNLGLKSIYYYLTPGHSRHVRDIQVYYESLRSAYP